MKNNVIWTGALTALAIMAAPASAQLLGGGIGGALGGSLGGSLGGGLSGVGSTIGSVGSSVTGSANGAFSGNANVDHRSGRASGSGSAGLAGAAQGSLGQLALAGSSAANASGSFDVMPGMVIEDVRGRAIGTVQDVRSTANGTVETVVMKVGDATANLPAANFSGSGNVLVSAMGKGEVKKAAKEDGSSEQQAAK